MTVGLLTGSVSRRAGGAFDVIRRLAQELRCCGVEVGVIGLRDADTAADLPRWDGVPVAAAEMMGPRSFGYSRELSSRLRELAPELVHVHGLWMYPSVACLRWAATERKPYLVSPHGMLDAWALRNSRLKKRAAAWLYERRHLRGAACLHALCGAEAEAIRSYGLRNPVCVIPPGVDLPAETDGGPASWDRLLPEDARVLLYLGRLHPKKGLSNLLRAWALLRRQAEAAGWRLVVAGWDQGGHTEQLRRLSEELGLTVQFVGPQFGEDKAASLRRADAFVLPSFSEGLPVAVLEAWAYGLPVLMTPQCNLPEGFEASAAIGIEPTPEGVASGLSELFRIADADRRSMGMRGRALVSERFSWPKAAEQMSSVYQWVLGAGARPECVRMD